MSNPNGVIRTITDAQYREYAGFLVRLSELRRDMGAFLESLDPSLEAQSVSCACDHVADAVVEMLETFPL